MSEFMNHPNQSADWPGTPMMERLRENLAALKIEDEKYHRHSG